MSNVKFYQLVLVERENKPGRISTASVVSCLLCNKMIDHMGGPGRALCEECAEDLITRRLRKAYRGEA